MRKDFGSKPMLYPMPVLIIGTYGEDGTPNAMNAAWGGIVDTNLIGICLADHKTTRNIFARKAFTVSMADAENMVAADYVGIVSGDKVPDKVARAGRHTSKSHLVDAPIIDELAEEYAGKAVIGKVNVDDNPGVSASQSIRNIPTLLFFKNGQLVDKHVGVASKSDLKAKTDALL
mgnify:CR=1 FL=1